MLIIRLLIANESRRGRVFSFVETRPSLKRNYKQFLKKFTLDGELSPPICETRVVNSKYSAFSIGVSLALETLR